MELDEVTKIEHNDLFRVNQKGTIPYERIDNTLASITIEMDLDVTQIERKVYTYFEMLSDAGGLIGIITTVFAFISSFWNYESLENFMVSRLYKIKKPAEEGESEPEYEQIKESGLPAFKSMFLMCKESFCKCLKVKRTRRETAMKIARE